MQAYKPEPLTEQEQILLQEIFSHTTVVKYLTTMSREIGDDILTRLPSVSGRAEEFRHQLLLEQGKLLVLDTLLSIHFNKEQQ